ncbi:YafY family protein [Sphingomonas sp. AOB5]|uniref:helix-turn-helix transcriptional regulator n=1 Tax=Sphingomonas sp. AOB5 TaxID=3034017 RepID=UPI0023F78A03|nr:YafY family protein [Sphingomonas sp. AOB5]MDF7776795.1 YafY family protein [Sphingomonas sp. AOB5]
MRASRLLAILILLQLRVRLTAEALAEEFEVSVRTIYRDIDSLSAAGIPVYGERGPGGGFQLLDGYRTRLTGLGGDEAQALPVIGLPGAAAAMGLGPAASRASAKLMASLTPALSEEAGRMSARFHVDTLDWYREEEDVAHLPALARAVLEQRRIAMTYESWRATGDWHVAPLGLVLKAGAWYLVAEGGGKIRTFRVSNILAQAVTEARFDRPEGFDLPSHWRDSLARFEQGLRPLTAELRLTPEGMRRLREAGAYAAKAVRGADGDRVTLPVESIDQAALLVLGLGTDAEVIAPPELRARVRDLAGEIARRAG